MTNEKSPIAVGENTEITLHFSLHLTDGSEIDSNFEGSPATFTYGDGSLLPGFEERLLGLAVGAKETFQIPAAESFGESNPENIHRMPKSQFSADLEFTEGLVISFDSGPSKFDLSGVVSEIEEAHVLMDFNHPLAGKDIVFAVEIVGVKESDSAVVIPERIDLKNLG